jgi:hypothetical protein
MYFNENEQDEDERPDPDLYYPLCDPFPRVI